MLATAFREIKRPRARLCFSREIRRRKTVAENKFSNANSVHVSRIARTNIGPLRETIRVGGNRGPEPLVYLRIIYRFPPPPPLTRTFVRIIFRRARPGHSSPKASGPLRSFFVSFRRFASLFRVLAASDRHAYPLADVRAARLVFIGRANAFPTDETNKTRTVKCRNDDYVLSALRRRAFVIRTGITGRVGAVK